MFGLPSKPLVRLVYCLLDGPFWQKRWLKAKFKQIKKADLFYDNTNLYKLLQVACLMSKKADPRWRKNWKYQVFQVVEKLPYGYRIAYVSKDNMARITLLTLNEPIFAMRRGDEIIKVAVTNRSGTRLVSKMVPVSDRLLTRKEVMKFYPNANII